MINQMILLVTGLSPAEMAEVVAERLARLDRLVVEVQIEIAKYPLSASPLDCSSWYFFGGRTTAEPSDGGRRLLRIVRPAALEESHISGRNEPILTGFQPGHIVRLFGQRSYEGRTFSVYEVYDDSLPSMEYMGTFLLQVFDLHVPQSFVAHGLNTLRLLRDYPARLVRSDGQVSTYALSIESCWPTLCTEHYEFDLNSRGTPMRFRVRTEFPGGPWLEGEVFTLATMELNGAELITEAVAALNDSAGPQDSGMIHHFLVLSARTDGTLSAGDVRLEPERRNAVVWTKTLFSEEMQEYDEGGRLIARSFDLTFAGWRRYALLPVSAVCGLVTAAGVAFASRPRRPHRA